MLRRLLRGFTLVEILIVVVILGILAAVVVPQFSKAVSDSAETATFDQLQRVRRAVSYYHATHNGVYPDVTAGAGTWGGMLPVCLREVPQNFWVPPAVSKTIVLGAAPDVSYVTTHGWIYNSATGEVWAGGFDGFDRPFPK